MERKRSQEEKVDRRISKTKKQLSDALMALIIEKGYDKVKVQDIIDRANVGRATFYMHYESKEQLLLGNISFQDELVNVPFDDPERYPMGINLSYFFKFSQEYLDLYHALVGTKCLDVLENHFTELFAAKITGYFKRYPVPEMEDNGMFVYQARAAAGALVSMYLQWLKDGSTYPPGEMIVYARKILTDLLPAPGSREGCN